VDSQWASGAERWRRGLPKVPQIEDYDYDDDYYYYDNDWDREQCRWLAERVTDSREAINVNKPCIKCRRCTTNYRPIQLSATNADKVLTIGYVNEQTNED